MFIQRAPDEGKDKGYSGWALALAPAFMFYQMMGIFGFSWNFLTEPITMVKGMPVNLLSVFGGLTALTGGMLYSGRRCKNIEKTLEESFKYAGLYTESKKDGVKIPLLQQKEDIEEARDGTRLVYHIPLGLCASDFYKQWERIEQSVGGEVSFYFDKQIMTMDILFGKLTNNVPFFFPQFPTGYKLPITIGVSRAGLIVEDLSEIPHLLVSGMTYGGKSVFLHQMIACLLRVQNCRLFTIDLARAEFSYLKRHSTFAYNIQGAHEILKFLSGELDRRLEILDKAGVEKIQNYTGDDLPYLVLVVDEFSALSPDLIKDRKHKEKPIRQSCQFLIIDLLARARKVGIHLVLSTQRPDADVLPRLMKSNIPGTVCFKVRNRVNSEICLDHGRAAMLPDTKGRAIWQFKDEREVQVLNLSPMDARKILPVTDDEFSEARDVSPVVEEKKSLTVGRF